MSPVVLLPHELEIVLKIPLYSLLPRGKCRCDFSLRYGVANIHLAVKTFYTLVDHRKYRVKAPSGFVTAVFITGHLT